MNISLIQDLSLVINDGSGSLQEVETRKKQEVLIGKSQGGSKLRKSYFEGNVTGQEDVGGLVGESQQKFQNHIAKDIIFAYVKYAGGIVGNSKSGATRAKNFTSTTVSATTGSLIGPIAGTHAGSFNGYAK